MSWITLTSLTRKLLSLTMASKARSGGVRRFQNADGSLTKAGKERYNEQNSSDSSDNHENQKFHLTEKQKKYCKTVAIATGAALVAYAGFKLADSGELNRLCEKSKRVEPWC